jgi:hypothetical protein
MTTTASDLATLTTPQLLEVAGLTRRQLQHLETAGAVTPLVKGRRGHAQAAQWSVMQAVAVAYAKAFLDAGCHHSWAYAAAAWVAGQQGGALVVEFARGRTLLSLLPTGEGRLVQPYLKPDPTREQRLKVAQLDLAKCYERVLLRMHALCPPQERQALDRQLRELQAKASRAGSEGG